MSLIAFDVLTAYFAYKDDSIVDLVKSRAPYGMYQLPEPVTVREPGRMGHSYVRHHHLTRNGTMILISRYSPMFVPATLAAANVAVIQKAPKEQRKGMWQMFSSGLTGTFGIGSGLNL